MHALMQVRNVHACNKLCKRSDLACTVKACSQGSQCLQEGWILVTFDSIEWSNTWHSSYPVLVELDKTTKVNHIEGIFNILQYI